MPSNDFESNAGTSIFDLLVPKDFDWEVYQEDTPYSDEYGLGLPLLNLVFYGILSGYILFLAITEMLVPVPKRYFYCYNLLTFGIQWKRHTKFLSINRSKYRQGLAEASICFLLRNWTLSIDRFNCCSTGGLQFCFHYHCRNNLDIHCRTCHRNSSVEKSTATACNS